MAAETLESSDPLQRALSLVVVAIDRCTPRYALIGGLATGFRSRPRFTKDVDLIVDVPQIKLPALLEELRASGFTFDTSEVIRDFTQHHLAVLWYDSVRIDWLKPVLPAYGHVIDTATQESGVGPTIRVASAEGLILLKLLAFRLQDQTDVEALIAANHDTLDVPWIKAEWTAIFPLDDPRMRWFLDGMARPGS